MSDAPAWLWWVLSCLLACSCTFSASETALFSLDKRQRESAGVAVGRLLSDPRALLVTLLFSNLVVNLLYFAFVGRLLTGVEGDQGWRDLAIGLCALITLLLCGEILPKTIGLRARVGVARLSAPLIGVLVALLAPVTAPLIKALEALNRLLALWFKEERSITADVLARVMERGAEDGALLEIEADLLTEVIELDKVRVREIMTPRVDALFLDIGETDPREVLARALERRQTWLPVVDGTPDRVLGRVHIREILRRGGKGLGEFVRPVKFVPEVASALDLLHELQSEHSSEAVVVDEWGGTAGFVTAEEIFATLVGTSGSEGSPEVKAVERLEDGRYRVAGGLSVRDWNEAFGQSVVPREFETVGGLVTALLGRIPRTGDEARLPGLSLVVSGMRGRRVATVDIGLAVELKAEREVGAA